MGAGRAHLLANSPTEACGEPVVLAGDEEPALLSIPVLLLWGLAGGSSSKQQREGQQCTSAKCLRVRSVAWTVSLNLGDSVSR